MPEVDSSIYGKLNTGAPNALQNMSPGDMIGLAQRSLDLQTRQGVSNAFKGAVGPGGDFDPQQMLKNLQRSPGAPTPEHAQAAIELGQRAQEFRLKQTQAVQDYLGTLADDPTMSRDRAWSMALDQARSTHIPAEVYLNFLRNAPTNPSDFHDYVSNLRNAAIGSAGTAGRVAGEPGAAGQPTTTTLGAANRAGTVPVGLPPGTSESMTAAAGEANQLHQAADAVPQQKAMLDELRDLSHTAASGPTTDLEKQINAFSQRWAGTGLTLTKEQLADTELFDKIAHQIAGQQASAAHATDAYLSNAYGANPSTKLSVLGRDGIISMLKGNARIPEVKRQAWLDYKSGAIDGRPHYDNEYREFSNGFNRQLDPRVFQFMEMNADQQKRFLGMVTNKEDRARFAKNLIQAQRNGWISSPNAQP